jgi:hypothetical protein
LKGVAQHKTTWPAKSQPVLANNSATKLALRNRSGAGRVPEWPGKRTSI